MKQCKEKIALIHLVVEGESDTGAEARLKPHLAECPDCSAIYEEFKGIKSLVEEALAHELSFSDLADADFEHASLTGTSRGRLRLVLRWASISVAIVTALMGLAASGLLYHLGFIGPKPVAARQTHISIATEEWHHSERKIRGMTTVTTRPNERRLLRLENGTLVVLNEGTSLEVQSVNQLQLLTGDVYIDTAGRKGVMLRVKTAHSTTMVTGTQLGVSATEEETSVIVEEGKVTVETGWGKHVVVYGNVFHIIQSMKPEPPEPVDVDEMFFWVKEREYLAGMIIDLYGQEDDDLANIENDAGLLEEMLYGLAQSRRAIQTGDVTFYVSTFSYGYDLSDEERKEHLEHVVAGHIAQLDLEEPPSAEKLRQIVQEVVDAATLTNRGHSHDYTTHWLFRVPDKARRDHFIRETDELRTEMIINGNMRYWPLRKMAERTVDEFPMKDHPAFFGRVPVPVSALADPRLLRTEQTDGTEAYVLEADIHGYQNLSGKPEKRIIRLWVDPSRGYIVLKSRTYVGGFEEMTLQSCTERIADSFQEISPGIFYPQVFIKNWYPGDVVAGEKILRREQETVYTISEGTFNVYIPEDAFDIQIPPGLEVNEYRAKWSRIPFAQTRELAKQSGMLTATEYLQDIYDELERIRLYDDPGAPASRKLVLNMNGEKLERILRRGGIIYSGAFYQGVIVGTQILRVDPTIAADVPFLKGDTIYTLNDEPWKVEGPMDWILGLEGCAPVVNAGKPVTAGVRRDGELLYVILWVD